MRTNLILGTALLMAGLTVGCSDDAIVGADSGTDSGTTVDTGSNTDTGTATDRGTATDTGTDAGTATDTGSTVLDVGVTLPDVQIVPTDSGTTTDAGTATDAGAAVTTIHGCTAAMYMDRSGSGDTRTIAFGGIIGTVYSPRCMTVAAGQTVTFAGPFGSHPLRGGSVSGDPAGASPNPITSTDTGTDVTVTFATPGLYPYFCNFHQPGMAGVIQVR